MQGMGKVAQQTVSGAQRSRLCIVWEAKMHTALAENQLTETVASPATFSVIQSAGPRPAADGTGID